ncbi:plasmid pRiA4b ORF-3 family protein [Maribacter sp. ACAM166]|uniref:plasmid pRiA4b ORF-3 family protein n=1 Tax=Maribacter sp. ACAM166 TaxID=2508996 RepID=UPI001485206C|nr:plasmid pRiA4b ORF-3 family protein [Maribacter sp. ACAM166]
MNRAFKFQIELEGSNPKIWREFLVTPETTFYRLHHIIQIVMGWENYHLYEFESENYRIGEQYEDDGYNGPNEVISSQNLRIGDVLKKKGQTFSYLYDFGDNWQHLITLETIIEDLRIPFTICCFGELNCPPEDVGSLPGFYDFLKIMENRKHSDYKNLKRWVKGKDVSIEGKYDSKEFYIERVNFLLMNLDIYIQDWEKESK